LAVVRLRQPKPDRLEIAKRLQEASLAEPGLLDEPWVIAGLVESLDHSNAASTIEFLVRQVGRRAEETLLRASADPRYWLHWNAIRTLKGLGAADEVDFGMAYIQDLRHGDTCNVRKIAAQKLAQLKDRRALPALKEAQQRSLLDNLCMFSALEEAEQTIEGR
jgi:HEAT repeat protein